MLYILSVKILTNFACAVFLFRAINRGMGEMPPLVERIDDVLAEVDQSYVRYFPVRVPLSEDMVTSFIPSVITNDFFDSRASDKLENDEDPLHGVDGSDPWFFERTFGVRLHAKHAYDPTEDAVDLREIARSQRAKLRETKSPILRCKNWSPDGRERRINSNNTRHVKKKPELSAARSPLEVPESEEGQQAGEWADEQAAFIGRIWARRFKGGRDW